MKITYRIAVLAGLLLFAGCAKYADVTNVVESSQSGNLKSMAEYQGDQYVTVRAIATEKNGVANNEIIGASCQVRGGNFNASVKTPSKVRVPLLGYKSTAVVVTCKHKDYYDGVITAEAYNKTTSDRTNAATGGGLLGVLVMGAINAASDEKKHEFQYRDFHVKMKPKAAI